MFSLSERFKDSFPEAEIGFLAVEDINLSANSSDLMLEMQKRLEDQLKQKFSGCTKKDLKELEEIRAYSDHYKKFKKTYHVLLQLESVALKGHELFRGNFLVQIMLMSELKNLLLTSVHDLEKTTLPILVEKANGSETYEGIDGTLRSLKANDMFMKDTEGIISSVIYGPDKRTMVDDNTRSALFAVYAPAGIGGEKVRTHLEDIRKYILEVSPEAYFSDVTVL
jgi:DNA/RNA-binding domain of Phe-tRNA-synthetase-like protein